MKKILFGALCTLAAVLIVRSCSESREHEGQLREDSQLIQKQIANVAKLVVTEGHFAEVYNYHDSQQLFGPLITAEKKALVVVNAEVTIAYDLQQLEFEVDEANRTLRLKHIPEPEIKINPDFQYYDVSADYLNPFEADDYNLIKERVNASLLDKINESGLMGNARNRLMSELSKLLFLSNSLEWTLEYESKPISSLRQLELAD
jgi:hypothetical protein